MSSDLDFREAVDIDLSILWEETIRFLCGQGRPVVAGALFVEFESGKEKLDKFWILFDQSTLIKVFDSSHAVKR